MRRWSENEDHRPLGRRPHRRRATVVAGFAKIQPVSGHPSEFLRIQLQTCSRTGCGCLPPGRFRVRPSGPTLRGCGGGRILQLRGRCFHQLFEQAVFGGTGGRDFDFAVGQGRSHAPRQYGTRSRRVGVTLVAALTGYRWTTIVEGMGTHRTTGKQGNQPDRHPTQHCARHRTNLSRPKPDSAFSELPKSKRRGTSLRNEYP